MAAKKVNSREIRDLVKEAESPDISQNRLFEIVQAEFPDKARNRDLEPGQSVFDTFYYAPADFVSMANVPLVRYLMGVFLKSPVVVEEIVFQKPSLIQRYWQDMAKNPMLPLWIESGNDDVLKGIFYYFREVECGVVPGSHKISFLYGLLRNENLYDEKILSLLEEGANEVGRFSIELPRPSPNENLEDLWDSFCRKHGPAIEARIFRMVTRKKGSRAAFPKGEHVEQMAIPYDDYTRQILTNNAGNNDYQRVLDYLRWLKKVALAVGKPMMTHILSEVLLDEALL